MSNLEVYHLPGRWGLPSVSPFCLKLDSFLKMAKIDHISKTAATPFGGPKKKAPWIIYNGKKIGDSALIIAFLETTYNVDVDDHLSAKERGISVAVQRLIEENLYRIMVYDRWVRPENWSILKTSILGEIPAPFRLILAPMARRGVKKQLDGHGMGLHSEQEIEAIAKRDIEALAGILGDGRWYVGQSPSMADATVYSVLANIMLVPFESPMKAMIAQHPALIAHMERFRAELYPE